jgi:hypothetical protein
MKLLADATAEYEKKLATVGKGDFAQVQWEVQFGKFAEAAEKAGADGAAALSQLTGVMKELGAAEEAAKATKATHDLIAEIEKLGAELKGKTAGDSEYEKMLARIMSGDLRQKLEEAGTEAVRYSEELLGAAAALDELARKQAKYNTEVEAAKALMAEAESVRKQGMSGWERMQGELFRIHVLMDRGAITYNEAVAAGAKSILSAFPEITQASNAMVRGLVDGAMEGKIEFEKIWSDMAAVFISFVERMVVEWVAGQIAMAAASMAFTGTPAAAGAVPPGVTGDVGHLLVEGLAFASAGASASPGDPFIVGEKGPELFVPGASGRIVPNNQLGGRSINLTYSPRLLDGRHASDWWDRNEEMIVKKIDRLSYLGRTGG